MTQQATNRLIKLGMATAILTGALLAEGCQKNRREDIPEGAVPQPVGTSVNEFFARQAQVGETDAFVVYLYEWDGEGTSLDAWSQNRLHALINRLPREPYLLVIEPSDDTRLDDARRRALISMVARQGVPHADNRVIIAYPNAEALYGVEAGRVVRGLFDNQQSSGSANTNSVVGGSGFSNSIVR